MMLEWSLLVFGDSPPGIPHLFDDFFPEFLPLLLLKDDHVVSGLTVYAGLILK